MNEEKKEMTQEEILEEADRLAAEVESELQSNIGDFASMPELADIPPELLEQMTPEQVLELLAAQSKNKRKSQAHYTRKQTPRAVRNQRRRAQKKARKITVRNGGGRTTPIRKRRKAA